MATIKESRYSKIENKIITTEDIQNLAKVIWEEYEKAKSPDKYASVSFTIKCSDKSCFESSDPSIFETDSVLRTKRVDSVSICCHCYNDSYINVELCNGNIYWGNDITVKGTDSNWVNGISKRLEDISSSFTPQNTFVKDHSIFLNILFAFGYGTIYMSILNVLLSGVESLPENRIPEWAKILRNLFETVPFLREIFEYLLGFTVGIFPAVLTTDKLKKLWPSVEIQNGPEHMMIEKRRRKWLAIVFTTCILPLALSLIYDIIKALFLDS